MIILADEEVGLQSRIREWVNKQSELKKLPLSGRKLLECLIDLTTLIFGEDAIMDNSSSVYPNSANIIVYYHLRMSPNGMRQVADGVNLTQKVKYTFTLIYYPDEQMHYFVSSPAD